MNILIPTDFSDNADLATEFAFKIAAASNGKVTVLHAYDLPYSDRSMSTSLLEVMKENAESNMKDLENKLRDKYQGEFETLVRLGNPIRLIAESSNLPEYDLVVMGTKGASGLEEVLIGSNAASVIQNTKKPVLVIPPGAAWSAIDKIVFACDLDPKVKEQPLQRLRTFAQTLGASIDVVHIQSEKAPQQGSRDFYSKNLEGVVHEFTILKNDDIEQAITAEAKKEDAKVIAAIAKRYGFFEGMFHRSITSRLAYHTQLPLLVLHEPK